jgi:hypothetical protein
MQIAGLSFSVLTNFGIFPESSFRLSSVGLSVMIQGVKPPLMGAASLSVITPYDRYPESQLAVSSVGLSVVSKPTMPFVCAIGLSIIQRTKFSTVEVTDLNKGYSYTMTS